MTAMVYRLIIPGVPRALPRGRPVSRHQGQGGRMVYPAEYRGWRAGALVLAHGAARGHTTYTGPVQIDVRGYWPRPQRRPAHVPAEVWMARLPFVRPSAPDGDNVLKAAMDLLNGIAYTDDRMVCRASVETWCCAHPTPDAEPEESPHTLIEVQPMSWLRGTA